MKVEVKNGKEIIIGKIFGNDVPFFVQDIKQLCFNPFADTEHKYSALVNTLSLDEDANLYISKKQYECLMEKLGAKDDDE